MREGGRGASGLSCLPRSRRVFVESNAYEAGERSAVSPRR